MNGNELRDILISIFPGFKEFWIDDDINRHEDGSFTAHGLMDSFTGFYRHSYTNFSNSELIQFCTEIERVVASDPDDKLSTANAICTYFLELIVDEPEGIRLFPFLGKACKKYYLCWK